MTYYGPKELAASFRQVRGNTLAIAQEIPEEKYSFSPAPGARTVAQMLVHIAAINRVPERMHGANRIHTLVGFDFPTVFGAVLAEEQKPRTKAEIIDLLKTGGERFASFLEKLDEQSLREQVTMPGGTPPTKSRLEMLLSAKEHEMHHRGQLMLVERMVGITPHLTRQMQERMAAQAQPVNA